MYFSGQQLHFEEPRCSYNIYLPPEVVRGEPFDHGVDIFAFGVSLAVSVGLHPTSEINSSGNEIFFMEDSISKAMLDGVLSAEAGGLLLAMVNRDPKQRISVEEIIGLSSPGPHEGRFCMMYFWFDT